MKTAMEHNPPTLVSCIMPTASRRRFVPLAIRYFLSQDYPNKELLILDDGDDSVAVAQLKGFLEEKDRQILVERESNKKTVSDANSKWKKAVKDHALLQAVALPKAIKPSEVKRILGDFVDVDDNGDLHVYEDVGFQRKRLSPSGAAMTVEELAVDYYDKNPHHIEGHTAGGGSGSEGAGGDPPAIDPNLPASERMKQFRRQQAVGQK